MNHQAILNAMRVLTISNDYHERRAAERIICAEAVRVDPIQVRKQCRICTDMAHPESHRHLCAEHSKRAALNSLRVSPFDMEIQADVAFWVALTKEAK